MCKDFLERCHQGDTVLGCDCLKGSYREFYSNDIMLHELSVKNSTGKERVSKVRVFVVVKYCDKWLLHCHLNEVTGDISSACARACAQLLIFAFLQSIDTWPCIYLCMLLCCVCKWFKSVTRILFAESSIQDFVK